MEGHELFQSPSYDNCANNDLPVDRVKMATGQGSNENTANIKCEICNKKVVNGIKCSQCEIMMHFKYAKLKDIADVDVNTWICNICEGSNILDETLYELLKKVLTEMEEKNLLLKEKRNYLSKEKTAVYVRMINLRRATPVTAANLRSLSGLTTLRKILNNIGFKWTKDNQKSKPFELPHIAFWRVQFLKAYMNNSSNESLHQFVYLHETWIFQRGTQEKSG